MSPEYFSVVVGYEVSSEPFYSTSVRCSVECRGRIFRARVL